MHNTMITNKDIIDIVNTENAYIRKLQDNIAAINMFKSLNQKESVDRVTESYDKLLEEYKQWLNQEVKHGE